MKKLLSLFLIVVVAAGCNKEKIYKENLNGVWEVYKYLLRNVDKTQQFRNQYQNYTIAFTESGTFTETYQAPNLPADTIIVNGTYGFTDNTDKIVLTHQYYTYTVDTAGDSTAIPHDVVRKYTLFNLTKTHVQLRNDTSQLYLSKKTE